MVKIKANESNDPKAVVMTENVDLSRMLFCFRLLTYLISCYFVRAGEDATRRSKQSVNHVVVLFAIESLCMLRCTSIRSRQSGISVDTPPLRRSELVA